MVIDRASLREVQEMNCLAIVLSDDTQIPIRIIEQRYLCICFFLRHLKCAYSI